MAIDRGRAASAIDEFLSALGFDPHSGELSGTGERVADAFAGELCEGYGVDARALLAAEAIALPAQRPAPGQTIALRRLAVTMTCPHHLMVGSGFATVAFSPRQKVVGVGAIARVVHAYARRLTLQETVGVEVVRALDDALQPKWVACRLVIAHACMTARGQRAHGARLETVASLGDEAAARAAVGPAK